MDPYMCAGYLQVRAKHRPCILTIFTTSYISLEQNITGNTNNCYDNNTTKVPFRQIAIFFTLDINEKPTNSMCVECDHCYMWR